MGSQILCVLPKLSSYKYQDTDRKTYIQNLIRQFIDWCTDRGLSPVFFKEDMLAVELLGAKDNILWLSAITTADEDFMIKYVGEYPETYKVLKGDKKYKRFCEDACSKYPAKNLMECKGNKSVYFDVRLNAIQARIRYTAEKALETSRCVAQFINNNNFTKEIKPRVGDGKLLITADFNLAIYRYTYGGVPCELEMIDKIIERI